MSDVTETLQELMERRLYELGQRRGRGESISLREAYSRMLDEIQLWNDEHADGDIEPKPDPPTYEVFRRIRNGHTNITDPTAIALATMLKVPVDEVYAAARIRPRLGRFELPIRADRLNESQRRLVVNLIDAIIAEHEPDFVYDDPKTGVRVLFEVKNATFTPRAVHQALSYSAGSPMLAVVREAVQNATDAMRKDPSLFEDLAARDSTD